MQNFAIYSLFTIMIFILFITYKLSLLQSEKMNSINIQYKIDNEDTLNTTKLIINKSAELINKQNAVINDIVSDKNILLPEQQDDFFQNTNKCMKIYRPDDVTQAYDLNDTALLGKIDDVGKINLTKTDELPKPVGYIYKK